MIEKIATCPYCGQSRMVQISDEFISEREQLVEAEKEAMLSCNCKQGEQARRKVTVLDAATANIEEMFGNSHPEIANMLLQVMEAVYDGSIRKLAAMDETGGRAEMKMTNKGLQISYAKTKRTELTTGL